jgi:hypothetical protein
VPDFVKIFVKIFNCQPIRPALLFYQIQPNPLESERREVHFSPGAFVVQSSRVVASQGASTCFTAGGRAGMKPNVNTNLQIRKQELFLQTQNCHRRKKQQR